MGPLAQGPVWVARTATVNGRTLKLTSQGFEDECLKPSSPCYQPMFRELNIWQADLVPLKQSLQR